MLDKLITIAFHKSQIRWALKASEMSKVRSEKQFRRCLAIQLYKELEAQKLLQVSKKQIEKKRKQKVNNTWLVSLIQSNGKCNLNYKSLAN